MESGRIVIEKRHRIARITISNTEKLNALNLEMIQTFRDILFELSNDEDIDIVVITGEGDRCFSVGADIANFEQLNSVKGYKLMKLGYEVHGRMSRMEQIFIAVVKGYCLAGGFEVALACDFIIASEDATFALPEIGLGIMPGWGGTIRLPRQIPVRKAKELILTGDRITANDALQFGLINKLAPKDKLNEVLNELLQKLTQKSPLAIRMAKNSINYGLQCSNVDTALAVERGNISVLFGSKDCQEGVSAFLEKREPLFAGE